MISVANVGQTDKIIRLLAGLVLIAVSFVALGGVETTAGVVSVVVGAILLLTGLFNFCPAYKIFNISSLKNTK